MNIETDTEFTPIKWETRNDELWNLYKHRTQYSPLPLVVTEGPEHIVRYANPAFCELAQKEPEELSGLPFARAVPEGEGNECLALLDRVFASGTTESISEQTHADESESPCYWAYSVWAVLEGEEVPPGVMIQVSEVSESVRVYRRRTEVGEALMLFGVKQHGFLEAAKAIGQKLQLAIRETEHRAKNSLQTISSFLSMQIRENPQAVPSIELSKLQMQIKTIAAMHDLLTAERREGERITIASLGVTLQKLLPIWQTIIGREPLEWNCDELKLPIRPLTTLLTVINELICNAVKHGAYQVGLRVTVKDGKVAIELSDNGPGFPDEFTVAGGGSFGLMYVDTVVKSELKGTIAFKNSPMGGALVEINFPVLEESASSPLQ